MSKKEARIARKNEKALQRNEKIARLVETVRVEQRPRAEHSIESPHTPRAKVHPGSIMRLRMEYRLHDYADRKGAWSWGQERNWCDPEAKTDETCVIRSLMIEMSGLLWSEIHAQTTGGKDRHNKHHSQNLVSLCEEAQRRWVEIDRTEDELFRFRVSGKGRVWGVRIGRIFYVVWWDREHMIYPVD